MKRDLDLIRDLLLSIERESPHNVFSIKNLPDIGKGTPETTIAHFNLLITANFVERARDIYGVILLKDKYSITNQGYDYLDSVRDSELWAKTKSTAEKAGGFTLEIVGEIAKGLLKTQIKKHAGIDI